MDLDLGMVKTFLGHLFALLSKLNSHSPLAFLTSTRDTVGTF